MPYKACLFFKTHYLSTSDLECHPGTSGEGRFRSTAGKTEGKKENIFANMLKYR